MPKQNALGLIFFQAQWQWTIVQLIGLLLAQPDCIAKITNNNNNKWIKVKYMYYAACQLTTLI